MTGGGAGTVAMGDQALSLPPSPPTLRATGKKPDPRTYSARRCGHCVWTERYIALDISRKEEHSFRCAVQQTEGEAIPPSTHGSGSHSPSSARASSYCCQSQSPNPPPSIPSPQGKAVVAGVAATAGVAVTGVAAAGVAATGVAAAGVAAAGVAAAGVAAAGVAVEGVAVAGVAPGSRSSTPPSAAYPK